MTLDQLRIFLAVAERGHMTRAAEALHMSQSAVSAAIAALEGQSRVALFNRVGRGIELSAAGEAFVSTARAVIAQAELARTVLDDLANEPRGRLRLYASQTVASYWLPARLIRLHERFPRIEASLTIGNTAQVASAVAAGSADLGFVEGDVSEEILKRRVVARDELVLVMSETHALAGATTLEAADYRGQAWILREKGSGTRSEFEAHLAQMGLTVADLDVALEIPSNEAVLSAVAAGSCVSMVSSRVAGSVRGICQRPVVWRDPPVRDFAVLTHPERHRTRAIEAMLGILDLNGRPAG